MTDLAYKDVADALGEQGRGAILPFLAFDVIDIRPVASPDGLDATDLLIETPAGGETCRMHVWLAGLIYHDVLRALDDARRAKKLVRIEAVQMMERHPVDGLRWWLGWIKIDGKHVEASP